MQLVYPFPFKLTMYLFLHVTHSSSSGGIHTSCREVGGAPTSASSSIATSILYGLRRLLGGGDCVLGNRRPGRFSGKIPKLKYSDHPHGQGQDRTTERNRGRVLRNSRRAACPTGSKGVAPHHQAPTCSRPHPQSMSIRVPCIDFERPRGGMNHDSGNRASKDKVPILRVFFR